MAYLGITLVLIGLKHSVSLPEVGEEEVTGLACGCAGQRKSEPCGKALSNSSARRSRGESCEEEGNTAMAVVGIVSGEGRFSCRSLVWGRKEERDVVVPTGDGMSPLAGCSTHSLGSPPRGGRREASLSCGAIHFIPIASSNSADNDIPTLSSEDPSLVSLVLVRGLLLGRGLDCAGVREADICGNTGGERNGPLLDERGGVVRSSGTTGGGGGGGGRTAFPEGNPPLSLLLPTQGNREDVGRINGRAVPVEERSGLRLLTKGRKASLLEVLVLLLLLLLLRLRLLEGLRLRGWWVCRMGDPTDLAEMDNDVGDGWERGAGKAVKGGGVVAGAEKEANGKG